MPTEEAFSETVLRELEQNRQRWQTLFEWNPNGVFAIDRSGRFAELNPACERIMGYSREELLGRSFHEVTAPESLEAAQQAFLSALGGTGVRARVVGFARDGTRRHLDMSVAPIEGDDGISGVLVMAHDETKRLQAEAERDANEAALRASEERYQAFISQSSEAIWRYEVDEPIPAYGEPDAIIDLFYKRAYTAECNEAVARMYGFERASELVGLRLGDTLPDTPENRAYLRAFIASGFHLTDAELEEPDRYGQTHFFSTNLLGIIENGFLVRAWGTQRDITEHRAIEAALRASEER
jgi:PAS domain S-box-containing protein